MTIRLRDLKKADFAPSGYYASTAVVKTWRSKGTLCLLAQVTAGPATGKYLLTRYPIQAPSESFVRIAKPSDLPEGARGDSISYRPASKLAANRFRGNPIPGAAVKPEDPAHG